MSEAAYVVSGVGRLNDEDIAWATGADAGTVGAWMRRTQAPGGAQAERLAELCAVVERLSRVMDPDYIPVWLLEPVPALGDEEPLDVVARGDHGRLSRLISGLESPTFS